MVPKSGWVWKNLGGWCCGSCQALLIFIYFLSDIILSDTSYLPSHSHRNCNTRTWWQNCQNVQRWQDLPNWSFQTVVGQECAQVWHRSCNGSRGRCLTTVCQCVRLSVCLYIHVHKAQKDVAFFKKTIQDSQSVEMVYSICDAITQNEAEVINDMLLVSHL